MKIDRKGTLTTDDRDAANAFNDHLDGTLKPWHINKCEYLPSNILKSVDPTHYNVAFCDWLDSLEDEEVPGGGRWQCSECGAVYAAEDEFDENDTCEWVCVEDSSAGVYIPQTFAAHARDNEETREWRIAGVDESDMEILRAGPDHEEYWDAWDVVMSNARIATSDGKEWFLWMGENGDLFLRPAA